MQKGSLSSQVHVDYIRAVEAAGCKSHRALHSERCALDCIPALTSFFEGNWCAPDHCWCSNGMALAVHTKGRPHLPLEVA